MNAPRTGIAAVLLALVAGAAVAAPAYKLSARLPGPDGRWDYASVDTANNRVLVAHGAQVVAFDLASGAATVLAPANGAHAALAVEGGSRVLITNGADNNVTFVDGRTGAQVGAVAAGKNPDAATFDPGTGLVLVMNHSGGDITLVDPKAMKAVGVIPVGGALEAAAVDGAGKAYVNVEDRNEVAVIDLKARKVVTRYKLAGCEGPTGIAYAPADKLLITTCDGVAKVLSAATGKIVSTIPVGDGADGVVFDPGQKLAFVPAGQTGQLSVIEIAKGKATLVQTVKTQTSARTLALDDRSGKVFLPAATNVPAAAPGGRPTQAPGSFVLLVVSK